MKLVDHSGVRFKLFVGMASVFKVEKFIQQPVNTQNFLIILISLSLDRSELERKM